MKPKSKFNIYLLMLVTSLIVAFSVNSIFLETFADTDAGSGGSASNGQTANWYHSSGKEWTGKGTTDAFKRFEAAGTKTRSKTGLKTAVNKLDRRGTGDPNLTLYESCQRSKYIWWYGDEFYTLIGVNVHPKLTDMKAANQEARDILIAFGKIPNNGWNQRGGTVLICSYNLEPKLERSLTFQADSGSFAWDGKLKEIKTFKLTKGNLSPDDKVADSVKAYGSGTNPGNYKVTFTTPIKIVSKKDGKNVTDNYKITKKNGNLKIHKKPIIVTDQTKVERCRPTGSDSVTAIVKNDVTVTEGYIPEGKYNVGPFTEEKYNSAYDMIDSAPNTGDPRDSWPGFASSFKSTGNNDLETETVSLSEMDAEAGLSKYGGVINVLRTHHKYKIAVTFCQPQVKVIETTTTTDAKGNEHTSTREYWEDEGEEIIETRNDTDDTDGGNALGKDYYSYQILGVNCNLEGFNRAKSATGAKDISYGDGKVSGLLQTPLKKGMNWPLASVSGVYTVGFYTDGTSCKEVFNKACTADKLVSAMNDADNNLGKKPLFTHEDSKLYADESGHGYPANDDVLSIFRDNESREIRAEVWYPRVDGVSGIETYPGEQSQATIAKIDQGSPEIEITTIKPFGFDDEEKIPSIGQEHTWIDHVNRFDVKSQWASNKGKHYETKLDWNYTSLAKNKVVDELDGKGYISIGEQYDYDFESHCTFRNEPGKYPANITNNPFYHNEKEVEPDWTGAGKLRTLFTRSVSDKSQN